MAHTLLAEIERAEQQADEILAQAERDAQAIIDGAGEAILAMEREADADALEHAQRRTAEAERATADEIKALELRRSFEREAMKRRVQAHVSDAGAAVFERVVYHGGR